MLRVLTWLGRPVTGAGDRLADVKRVDLGGQATTTPWSSVTTTSVSGTFPVLVTT